MFKYKGRVQKLKSAKVWSLTIPPPPNLNYGLFTQNFLTPFFSCKYVLNLSKWILKQKKIKILTLRLTACTLNIGAKYIAAL